MVALLKNVLISSTEYQRLDILSIFSRYSAFSSISAPLFYLAILSSRASSGSFLVYPMSHLETLKP